MDNISQQAVLCYAVKHSKSFAADRIFFTFTSVEKVSKSPSGFLGLFAETDGSLSFSKDEA